MAKTEGWLKRASDSVGAIANTITVLGALGVGAAIRALLKEFVELPGYWILPIFLLSTALAMFLIYWLLRRYWIIGAGQQGESGISTTLSNLTGASPRSSFDSNEMFRIAFFGQLLAQLEANVRDEAMRVQPNDRESFFLKVIGVAGLAYIYDLIWWPLLKSQLLALLELNRTSGRLPLSRFRDFYEAAVEQFPKEYQNDDFERWMSFLSNNGLLIRHPSDMVDITHKGKDFLKYLLHWGREPESKRL